MKRLSILLLIGLAAGGPACARAATSGLRVRGNHLVFGSGAGQPVQLRGVNRSGTEYACIQGWGLTDGPLPARIDSRTMIAAMLSWNINVVRVPLNEDCWLGINTRSPFTGLVYRAQIVRYVSLLHAAGLFAILDLHWAAPGRVAATRQLPMADADHAPAFWRSVAATFRSDHDVLFDLFNEPYSVSWACWRDGCRIPASGAVPAYRAAGMQQLVDAVRPVGATQPLLLGGLNWSADLSKWLANEPHDPLHQLVASEHNYGGLSPCSESCRATVAATARRVPVVFGELGETDCAARYIGPLMRFADAHAIGYLGWAWDATSSGWSCRAGPALITSYDGHPTPFGAGFRDHLLALGMPLRP